MKPERLFFPVMLLLLSIAGFAAAAPARADAAASFEAALFEATNAVRLRHGLYPLAAEPRPARSARAHSEAMSRRGRLSHQLPGEPDAGARLEAAGYDWAAEGENVAHFPIAATPQAVLDAWMGSADHRRNLLAADVWEMGLAVVIGPLDREHPGVPTWWVTQDFGREGDARHAVCTGRLVVAPAELTLKAAGGGPATGTLTLTNTGSAACARVAGLLRVEGSGEFSLAAAGFNLAPGESRTVTVIYRGRQPAAGTARVTASDPAAPEVAVALRGSAEPPAIARR